MEDCDEFVEGGGCGVVGGECGEYADAQLGLRGGELEGDGWRGVYSLLD